MAVLVAAPLKAPSAREARAAVRLSMATTMQAASALETVYGGAEGVMRGGDAWVVVCSGAVKGERSLAKH